MQTLQKDGIRDYVSLFKLRIVMLLVFVSLVATVTATKGALQPMKVVLLATAGALASAGASILNHYFDRDIDALMDRTRERPLPAGKVTPHKACWLGILLVALSMVLSSRLNYLTSAYILAGVLVYVLVYTVWLKRRSAASIVIGGAAGSCAILAGYAALKGSTPLVAILVALLMFLWTPPHFWTFAMVHKAEYQKASIPMLPVNYGDDRTARFIFIHTVLLVQASLLLYAFGYFGTFYLITAVVFGLTFEVLNTLLLSEPTKGRAWGSYRFSGIYLVALFTAMLLDSV